MKLTRKETEKICKEYNLGKLKKFELIKGGLINHNFIFKTNKGKFIIRVFKKNPEKKELEFKLLNYLHKKKFPYETPLPLKKSSGEYILKISKKNLWVYKLIEGKHVKWIDNGYIRQIAKALAQFHLTVKDFKAKELKEDKIFELDWLLKEYGKLKKVNPKNKYDKLMLKNIDFFIKLTKKTMKYKFRQNLSIVHTDINLGNLLFNNKKLIGILDFDNFYYAPRVVDVAYIIPQFCMGKNGTHFDKKKVKSFLREYEKISKLTKREKEMLIPLMIRYNCIVFWWFHEGMKKNLKKKYDYMQWTLRQQKSLAKLDLKEAL